MTGPTRLLRRPPFILILALGLPWALYTVVDYALLLVEAPVAVGLAIGLPVIVAAALVALMLLLGARAEIAPALAAIAWGTSAIALLAATANHMWGSVLAALLRAEAGEAWSRALAAGPVEEAYKLLGVLVIALCWPGSASGALRGMTLGMLVGLSFGTIEHAGYLAGWAIEPLGTFLPVEAVLWGFFHRAFAAGLFLHVAFTGISGLALGWALGLRMPWRWLVAFAGYAVAAALHSIVNSPLITGPGVPWQDADVPWGLTAALVRSIPFLLAIGALVLLARRSRPSNVAS